MEEYNMKEMKVRRILGVAIAMMVLLAVSAVPAIACPCEQQEPIDEMGQQKVLKAVSKELFIPDEYELFRNPDGSGFVLAYRASQTSFTLVDISTKCEIREVWNGVTSTIPGGFKVVLTSDKGNEVSATLTDDPSSNSAKLVVYDSSSGEVTTLSVDCYDICFGACAGVVGAACIAACGVICSELIPTGIGYFVCLGICYAYCGGATVIDCDYLCNLIC
ncbi:MAG: hypothetical protein U9N86_10650 [Bacteroidota bacterium]|nr:hypothetical protein [Bacteroidota bacterium]